MTNRLTRFLRRLAPALGAALAVGAVAAAPAGAAPRVVSVKGFYAATDANASYVILEVRTRRTGRVRLRWRNHGGASDRPQNGRLGLGFARRGREETYRVSLRACDRNGCGRVQRFSGRFVPLPPDDESINGQGGSGGEGGTGGGGGGGLIPGLPGVPPLPGVPLVSEVTSPVTSP